MKKTCLLLPMLCVAPFIESCSSLPTTIAGYGLQSMLDVRNSKETPEMYYDVGRYYQAQGRWEKAARAYEKSLALDAHYTEAANALATCYAMQGQYDLAAAKLEEAIKQEAQSAHLYNNLGYVYYLEGRYPAAITALKQATDLSPRNRRAWRNLGLAYTKAGMPDEAREAYAQARRDTPQKLLENWRASRPAPASAQPETAPAATPAAVRTPATHAAQAGMPSAGSSTVEIVPVAPNIYELKPLDARPVAGGAGVAKAAEDRPAAQPTLALKPFRVEVSNGNGTTGLARRVSELLKDLGIDATRLTNQKPWQRDSEIQFRQGYALEAAKLAGLLNQQPLTVRNDHLRWDVQVRLVIGKVVRDEYALVAPAQRYGTAQSRLASAK